MAAIEKMRARGNGARSISRRVECLKTYYKFLRCEGIAENGTSSLRLPVLYLPNTIPRPLPRVLMVEEVRRLIETPGKRERCVRLLETRDRAVLELLYGAGLRTQELLGLMLGDIDPDKRFVKVLGKGAKERLVPFGEPARDALVAYSKARSGLVEKRQLDPTTLPVFVSRIGRPLDSRDVRRIMKHRLRVARLDHTASPHSLRHSCATHMHDSGCGIRELCEFLGHVSISTTMIYTHVSTAWMLGVFKKCHPRA